MEPVSQGKLEYVQEINKQCDQMGEYLLRKVDDGLVKDRLSDQLKWLQYQIKYYSEKRNFELLEENYNWVASNFNHDLRLPNSSQFAYLRNFTNG